MHLSDRIVGPKVRCDLVAVGVGEKTPEGNAIVAKGLGMTLRQLAAELE